MASSPVTAGVVFSVPAGNSSRGTVELYFDLETEAGTAQVKAVAGRINKPQMPTTIKLVKRRRLR
jgi:hypothetical protein